MVKASMMYKKAAVIGGGLLGLEAARGLLNLGMEVTVIHLGSHLMDRQLDPVAGQLLQAALEKQGMSFLLGKQTNEILGDTRVEGLTFSDGSTLETDMVVMAAGIKPNHKLAETSGIEVNRGLSSMISWKQVSRGFTQSENVLNIEDKRTVLLRHYTIKQTCLRSMFVIWPRRLMKDLYYRHS